MIRVFLGGEGVHELGRFAHHPSYAVQGIHGREVEKDPGILEALTTRLAHRPVRFVGGLRWKAIRKRKVPGIRAAEILNVVGLVGDAVDAECDAVVFVRDRDRDPEREADIEEGLRQARKQHQDILVIGGVAVEEIEAWLLAMLCEPKSEAHKRPKEVLMARHSIANRHDKTRVVEAANLAELPNDAASLHRWIQRFATALPDGAG